MSNFNSYCEYNNVLMFIMMTVTNGACFWRSKWIQINYVPKVQIITKYNIGFFAKDQPNNLCLSLAGKEDMIFCWRGKKEKKKRRKVSNIRPHKKNKSCFSSGGFSKFYEGGRYFFFFFFFFASERSRSTLLSCRCWLHIQLLSSMLNVIHTCSMF